MAKITVRARLEKLLLTARIVPELTDLLGTEPTCHLVGGAVRNVSLGLPVDDIDFALPGDPSDLAKRFAQRIGGHWFVLDELRRQSRVVAGPPGAKISYDFAPWRADTLEADLALRDYTINAMALPLKNGGGDALGELVDPLGGAHDLETGTLRCCSETVLTDDPLRVLKGVRHCLVLGLKAEDDTFERMKEAAPMLAQSASERILAELGLIFTAAGEEGCALFGRLGLPEVLFGRGDIAGGAARLQSAKDWLAHLARPDARLGDLFDEVVEECWPRRSVLKLAAFLQGYQAEGGAQAVLDRLGLGRRATALLRSLLNLSPECFAKIDRLPPTTRGRALWVDSLGPGRGEGLVLLAALAGADPRKRGPQVAEVFTDFLSASGSQGRIPDLVGGDWIRDELGVEDGPRIGELLAALRLAEIEGRVGDIDEARGFLRSLSKK